MGETNDKKFFIFFKNKNELKFLRGACTCALHAKAPYPNYSSSHFHQVPLLNSPHPVHTNLPMPYSHCVMKQIICTIFHFLSKLKCISLVTSQQHYAPLQYQMYHYKTEYKITKQTKITSFKHQNTLQHIELIHTFKYIELARKFCSRIEKTGRNLRTVHAEL